MSTRICWCCQINLCWPEYEGTEYLSDDGEKPCFDCVEEMLEDDAKTLDLE